ncbi:MAG: AhpC/TSA family protein [Duncaniella sp.]|nr:AhpC/TSA family protein [Duncaniella sp.]
MKKSYIAALMLTAAVNSGCTAEAQQNYTVNAAMSPDMNDHIAYIIDWDSSEPIDSAIVSGGKVHFAGHVDGAKMGRLIVAGKRGPIFVLEPGSITIDENNNSHGTPQNDRLTAVADSMNALVERINSLDGNNPEDVEKYKVMVGQYEQYPLEAYKANKGSMVGLYWFLQSAYEMNLDQLDAALREDGNLRNSARVKSLRNALLAKENTMPGKHYKDFEIIYDGKKQKLSTYVDGDHYTLVDFWASWCGPCMRQTPVIRGLYDKYKDKGLEVVGVAVWDEPENTLKAIRNHDIPWPCIINAQTIPTDLYGISGIPCIILIAPDGTIVSRDKQGDELVADVDKAMTAYLQEKAALAARAAQAEVNSLEADGDE